MEEGKHLPKVERYVPVPRALIARESVRLDDIAVTRARELQKLQDKGAEGPHVEALRNTIQNIEMPSGNEVPSGRTDGARSSHSGGGNDPELR